MITVLSHDRVVMLKTLKRAVRVVWIYRKTLYLLSMKIMGSDNYSGHIQKQNH